MKEQNEEHHKAYIRQLIYENNMIEAIKYIRELTGKGLKESKELCNIFMNDLTKLDDYSFFQNIPEIDQEFNEFVIQEPEQKVIENIKSMLQRGEKLAAVKFAKEILNIGLKEAKELVENLIVDVDETEFITEGENEMILIEQNVNNEEVKKEEQESTLKIILTENDVKKKKAKSSSRITKEWKPITFGKIEKRDKLKQIRNKSNSGCMVSLMIILIIALSAAGTFLFF